MIVPAAAHDDVEKLGHRLEVIGAVAEVVTTADSAGNVVVDVYAPRVEAFVEFHLVADLERASAAAGAGTECSPRATCSLTRG